MALSPALCGWLLILVGGCANVLSLEYITQRDKGAGKLLSAAQFAFIAAEGLIQQWDFRSCRLSPRVIPLRRYLWLSLLFFTASVLNNVALGFNISVPVHTVFRSAGLAGTLAAGWGLYGRRYSTHQVVTCMLICAGICTLTIADASARKGGVGAAAAGAMESPVDVSAASPAAPSQMDGSSNSSSAPITSESSSLFGVALSSTLLPMLPSFLDVGAAVPDARWLLGIGMLCCTLLILAVLGFEQERTYAQYGKVWQEVIFYLHATSLPLCILLCDDIVAHVHQWMQPDAFVTVHIPGIGGLHVSLWVLLGINLVTQSVCFKGVCLLTANTSALTLSLALTLRKFFSLLLSILSFATPFSHTHWCGATMVFGGILAYGNERTINKLWGGGQTRTGAEGNSSATTQEKDEATPALSHPNGNSCPSPPPADVIAEDTSDAVTPSSSSSPDPTDVRRRYTRRAAA